MKSLKGILIDLFLLTLLWLLSVDAKAQEESTHILYLKNGSVIRGAIVEVVPGQSVKIKTSDGSLFVFDMNQVIKAKKINASGRAKKRNSEQMLQKQMKLNGLNNRKQLDLIGLTTIYGLTIVGDIAAGGDFFYGSAIPVVGPFINIGITYDKAYFNPDDAQRDRLLSLLSGIIQTGFFVDFLITSQKARNLQKSIDVSFRPNAYEVKLSYSF